MYASFLLSLSEFSSAESGFFQEIWEHWHTASAGTCFSVYGSQVWRGSWPAFRSRMLHSCILFRAPKSALDRDVNLIREQLRTLFGAYVFLCYDLILILFLSIFSVCFPHSISKIVLGDKKEVHACLERIKNQQSGRSSNPNSCFSFVLSRSLATTHFCSCFLSFTLSLRFFHVFSSRFSFPSHCLAGTGFFWDDSYGRTCLEKLFGNRKCELIFDSLRTLLSLSPIDAEPVSHDARRRLLVIFPQVGPLHCFIPVLWQFFMNSMFMTMLRPSPVKYMPSWSTLTPFYSEDVVYSNTDLLKETQEGVSVLYVCLRFSYSAISSFTSLWSTFRMYLQTIFPRSWLNFLERAGVSESSAEAQRETILNSEKALDVRLWATCHGQTLFRTAAGMMLYQKALQILACMLQTISCFGTTFLLPSCFSTGESFSSVTRLDDIVKMKFSYVVSCQVYGKQKQSLDKKVAILLFFSTVAFCLILFCRRTMLNISLPSILICVLHMLTIRNIKL